MITIDGRPVPAQGTVLDACRAAGVPVPTLCHDPRLSPGGHCRACLVQMDGAWVAACHTPARDGATVRTDLPELREYRRDLGELMLAESAPAGLAREHVARWGADGARYAHRPRPAVRDHTHAHVRLDLDRCILCRRCVRACEEIQGAFALAVEGRGAATRLAWGGGAFADGTCVACGACLTVCPSEALTSHDTAPHFRDVRVTRTTCGECSVGCAIVVHVTDGPDERVSHVEAAGLDAPNRGHLCARGRFAHHAIEPGERLTQPLVRRNGALEPASWDEAIVAACEGLHSPRGAGAIGSARATGEELYLLQKFARGVLGTNDVDTGSRLSHAPSDVAFREAFGAAAATASFDDLERADVLMVTGADPDAAHPVLAARLRQAALAGATLIVVDPRRTPLAELADVHLAVRPGANVPLLNALACTLLEEDLVDHAFLESHVAGLDVYAPFVRRHTPERWQDVTGVPAATLRRAARLLGRAQRPWFAHGLGVTEHRQGTDTVRLLANLALLTGAVGREGTGVLPLRPEANAQGALDAGAEPGRLPGGARVDDAAARARVLEVWGRPVPEREGRPLDAMLAAARAGELGALLVLGEDVLRSAPDARCAREALESLGGLVVMDSVLTPTATWAHVVLPIADAFERDGTLTSAERRVQRVRRALDPPGDARDGVRVLLDLFAACRWPQSLETPADVLADWARTWPEGAGLSHARLDRGGLAWPVPDAAHEGSPRLAAPAARARLACVDFERSPEMRGTLALLLGQRFEHAAGRAGSADRDGGEWLELHAEDAAERGVDEGDRVRVRSEHGEALVRARLSPRLRRGTAYLSFRDSGRAAGALAGSGRDRETGCPEYKLVAIEIEHADG